MFRRLDLRIAATLIGRLALLVAVQPLEGAEAFWLTDGTLFAPKQLLAPPEVSGQNLSAAQVGGPVGQVSEQRPSNEAAATSRVEPWIQLVESTPAAGSPSADVAANQAKLGQLAKQVSQPSGCQCSADWLQGQTNLWLNKWMSSAAFSSQLRQSMATLTNATSGRSVAWSRPSRRYGGGAKGAPTVASHPADGKQAERASRQSQQPPPVQPLRGPQGEPGPKGERGERGERGPSGLVSVKDRDALFDLALAEAGKPNERHWARLAFVESEQLLVVDTALGWRPLQMLGPLRDFRKTIAKFSLKTAEQRRRLLAGDKLASPTDKRRPLGNNLSAMLAPSIDPKNPLDGFDDSDDDDAHDGDYDDDDDDDDDDEEEEDEDDEDDEDDDSEPGDERKDDEDQEDALDDDMFEDEGVDGGKREEGKGAGGGPSRETNSIKSPSIKPTSLAGGGKPKRRRAQVSGRSAVALASLDGETAMEAESNEVLPSGRANQEGQTKAGAQEAPARSKPEAMRLRLVALNEPFAGNRHGLRGANFECKRHAARANIRGAFKALLATNYQHLNEIVRHGAQVHKYPLVNLRGELLASSWQDLFKSPARMTNPLSRIYSFDGRHVASDQNWPNKLVWHGAGNKFGHRDFTHNCDAWHSDSLNKFGFATPIHSPKGHAHSQHQQQQQKLARVRHNQHRRGAEHQQPQLQASSGANSTNLLKDQPASGALVFDVIEKYPCRMPLIVLCIETIAQGAD